MDNRGGDQNRCFELVKPLAKRGFQHHGSNQPKKQDDPQHEEGGQVL